MTLDETFFDNIHTSMFGIPKAPGVYAVCLNYYRHQVEQPKETILYIGSSKNMKRRLASDKHPYLRTYRALPDVLIYTKCFETEDYLALEKELIALYKPLLNTQYAR